MQFRSARGLAGAAVIGTLASLGAASAHAQPETDAAAAVGACRRVPDRSTRLDCYDRAFPPLDETEARQNTATQLESSSAPRREESSAPRRERRGASEDESAAAFVDHARIVEVQMPSVTTTVLVTADGRSFVRTNSTTVVRWPEAPFEVDIEKSWLGTSLYLVHPRTGERLRVAVRD
jgi:hypothetical protein